MTLNIRFENRFVIHGPDEQFWEHLTGMTLLIQTALFVDCRNESGNDVNIGPR